MTPRTTTMFVTHTPKICAAAAAASACLSLSLPAGAQNVWTDSGAAAAFMDVPQLVRESIHARTNENMRSPRTDGGSIWLDLKGATSESDTSVAGASGWDTDIYGLNLGADIKRGDSFFGVVYTYANADGDSQGLAQKMSTDIDFWGVSIFGQQTFGVVSLFGAAGWMYVSGDADMGAATYDADGNIWTADLGIKGIAHLGPVSIVPYAKAELTYLQPENFHGGEPDNLRIYQFPVGVNAAWEFTAGDWTLTPAVDLAVVPTAGDTDATGKLNGAAFSTQFYNDDTFYRAGIEFSAKSEHAVFGLSYRYLDGSDGYAMHMFGARAEYVF